MGTAMKQRYRPTKKLLLECGLIRVVQNADPFRITHIIVRDECA